MKRTFTQWRRLGYKVRSDVKTSDRNKHGHLVFDITQVEEEEFTKEPTDGEELEEPRSVVCTDRLD